MVSRVRRTIKASVPCQTSFLLRMVVSSIARTLLLDAYWSILRDLLDSNRCKNRSRGIDRNRRNRPESPRSPESESAGSRSTGLTRIEGDTLSGLEVSSYRLKKLLSSLFPSREQHLPP